MRFLKGAFKAGRTNPASKAFADIRKYYILWRIGI